MNTLNEVFSKLAMRRRYEVWFVRLGLADGTGAWWFRYLLMNPGRAGCPGYSKGMPVQVWATWFPVNEKPRSFIRQLPLSQLNLSATGASPFRFCAGANEIGESYCRGALNVDGHAISWTLQYESTFRTTLSSKGWIGFSQTPHSDAVFSGEITLDGQRLSGHPLGFGVQGHNCGYRHRHFWKWMHAHFLRADHSRTTLEALMYEMPFGLVFKKAVLWHDAEAHVFRNLRETNDNRNEMLWNFDCVSRSGMRLHASIDGRGTSLHRLHYVMTDCTGTFEVMNNSLAGAGIEIARDGRPTEKLKTQTGAVLEIVG